jgi:hypothetical protein
MSMVNGESEGKAYGLEAIMKARPRKERKPDEHRAIIEKYRERVEREADIWTGEPLKKGF